MEQLLLAFNIFLLTQLFHLIVADLRNSPSVDSLRVRTAGLKIAATYAGNLFGGILRASFRVRANTWALLVSRYKSMYILVAINSHSRIVEQNNRECR